MADEGTGGTRALQEKRRLTFVLEPEGFRVARVSAMGEFIARDLEGEVVRFRIGERLRSGAGMQLLARRSRLSGTAMDILRASTFGEQQPTEFDGAKLADTDGGLVSAAAVMADEAVTTEAMDEGLTTEATDEGATSEATDEGVTTEATQPKTAGFAL